MIPLVRFVLWVAACFLVAGGVFRLGRGEYGLALADWLGAAVGVVGFGLWRSPRKPLPAAKAPAAQATPPLLSDEQVLDRILAYARKEQVPILPRSWQMWSQKPCSFGATTRPGSSGSSLSITGTRGSFCTSLGIGCSW